MSGKKVLVLAGTKWQIPLINELHKKNCFVYNVNLYADSPAFKYADETAVMDILDKEACLEYAKEKEVDAVMSEQCDIATPSIAYIAEKLGVPGIGYKNGILFSDKSVMRDFCRENGIPTPAYRLCFTAEEAVDFFACTSGKMIMKPINSSSSHGVFTITSADEIPNCFENSYIFSKGKKAVLCEQYIEGPEFTVDGIVFEDGHKCVAISEKKHYEYNKNVANELFFSYANQNYDYDLLRKTNDDLVDKTGLPFGFTHAEYKYENGVFYLIEIGARGGGNLISSMIVPAMSGINNYEYIVSKALGEEYSKTYTYDDFKTDRCAVLHFFDLRESGTVKEIENLELLKDPRILDYAFNFEIGDSIKPCIDDTSRVGYYIAMDKDIHELRKFIDRIEDLVKIIVE